MKSNIQGNGNQASSQLSVISNSSGGFFGAFDDSHSISAWADRAMFGAYSSASGISVAAYGSTQDIRFITGSTTNERMRITNTGNVGIGTSLAAARLHLVKNAEQLRLGYDTDGTIYMNVAVGPTGITTLNTTGSSAAFSFSDNIGVGVIPLAKLHSQGLTEQLRLSYDIDNYVSTTISSAGLTTFNAVGSAPSIFFDNKLGYSTNGSIPTTISGRDGVYFSDVALDTSLNLTDGILSIDTAIMTDLIDTIITLRKFSNRGEVFPEYPLDGEEYFYTVDDSHQQKGWYFWDEQRGYWLSQELHDIEFESDTLYYSGSYYCVPVHKVFSSSAFVHQLQKSLFSNPITEVMITGMTYSFINMTSSAKTISAFGSSVSPISGTGCVSLSGNGGGSGQVMNGACLALSVLGNANMIGVIFEPISSATDVRSVTVKYFYRRIGNIQY